MKKRGLIVTLVLGLGMTLALLWVLGDQTLTAAAPAELHVCPSGCTYSSIQAAVDAANPGDVIKIATGVYTDVHSHPAPPGYPYPWPTPTDVVTQVVYISKTVTIRGGYTAPDFAEPPNPDQNPTTLDAQHQGRVIFAVGDATPTIQGLMITGGGLEGHPCLGREPGGGVYVGSTAATIQDNQAYGNLGGGVFVEHSTIIVSRNLIADNEACDGAGLTVSDSSATISDNLFSTNDATSAGGGMWLVDSDATLANNVVIDNTASWCGGVEIYNSDATLVNDAVVDNHVHEGASGLCVIGSSSRLLHNTIARNTGADGSGVRVEDLTGEGIHSTVSLSNTIMVNQSVGIIVGGGETVTVTGILWYGTPIAVSQSPTATVEIQNPYTGDPAFAGDGYHITAGSAAIDRGIDAGVTVDIDGEPRPAGAGYDLGADELWYKIYLPLMLRDS